MTIFSAAGSKVAYLRYFLANRTSTNAKIFFSWSALIFSEESEDMGTSTEVQTFFCSSLISTSSKETKPFGTQRSFYFDTVKNGTLGQKVADSCAMLFYLLCFAAM